MATIDRTTITKPSPIVEDDQGQLRARQGISREVVSELSKAFQIAFLLFLPFLVIDIVVSSILMGMGMMMLPPVVVSLPFKLLLFVAIDGWGLLARSLVAGYH